MKVNYHQPVLLRQVLENLAVKKNRWYLDATLGDGGHSLGILRLGGKVVGIDQDPEALERARMRLLGEGFQEGSYRLIRGNFRDVVRLVKEQKVQGILFDLGVSTHQLVSAGRGFSFQQEANLDMRMDPDQGIKASELVNALNVNQLGRLLKRFGEVKDRRVALAIVNTRPVTSTTQLAEVVARASGRRGRIHPATQVFQALRIAVNDELNALQAGLDQAVELVKPGGRIVVLSYHSLEDRIVKNTYHTWQKKSLGQPVTKKPIVPSQEEIRTNPRSRSAKLRIFKK